MDRSKYPPPRPIGPRAKFVRRHGLPEGVHHGESAYLNWGCRCEVCTEEHAESTNEARENRLARTEANGGVAPTSTHNKNTYQNWGCRCKLCSEDYAEHRVRAA